MEETSWLAELLANHFVRGLAVGLLIAFAFWLRSIIKVRTLHGDVRKLRGHLQTKFEIESADNERRKEELNQLRTERDHLRNANHLLLQKPGRLEIRQAQVYQKAVEIMFEKSPGFAPVWQITLREAEEEMRNAEKGLIPFFRRITSSSPAAAPAAESKMPQHGKHRLELDDPANL
ncbi:hypothetical protein VU07_05685 [Desulfobulbus sp. F4]|nr:hypothetical protein [Desulfobulbus sp. F4]